MAKGGIRVTGGQAKGRSVAMPQTGKVRPTSARVREALFSMMGQDLSGDRFLDAYGGSGIMGIEAWSRGAEVTIAERDPGVVKQIRASARSIGADVRVVQGDVLGRRLKGETFTLVFADPPYAKAPGDVLPKLSRRVGELLLFEADRRSELPEEVGGLRREDVRRFGNTVVGVYRRVVPLVVDDGDAS